MAGEEPKCCFCIEMVLGQKILGVLFVLQAIGLVLNVSSGWGAYGIWALLWVPAALATCFAAFKYVQWMQKNEKEQRLALLVAWKYVIAVQALTYVVMALLFFFLWGTLTGTDLATPGVSTVRNSVAISIITQGIIACLWNFWFLHQTTEYVKFVDGDAPALTKLK